MLLMTAFGNIEGAVRAMRDGAVDYLVKPFAPEVLLNQVKSICAGATGRTSDAGVWRSKQRELLQLAAKVGAFDASVMISGPSGTGKEVLARYIHDQSSVRNNLLLPLTAQQFRKICWKQRCLVMKRRVYRRGVSVRVNLNKRRAAPCCWMKFTEMDPALQAKLLRVLQEREVERLGSRTISLDVK